jgi:2-haloalkanoic acid dehalogenase type II
VKRYQGFWDVTEAALRAAVMQLKIQTAQHNGLTSCFAEIISVDRVRTYKPTPRVYALAPEVLGCPPEEILFVSSNSWDVAGAKSFGYKVCWCKGPQSPRNV